MLWHRRTELTEVPGGYERCFTRTPGIVARGVPYATEDNTPPGITFKRLGIVTPGVISCGSACYLL